VEILDNLRSLKPAGVLLAPIGRISKRAAIEKFCANVPTVLFDNTLADLDVPFVGSDTPQFGALIVDYLCRTGTPPSFVEMATPANPNANRRRQAYIRAMEAQGHQPHIVKLEGEGWNFEEVGRREGRRALTNDSFPTGTVLCSNDRIAIGFLAACYEAGMRTGRTENCEIRVAGQDDHPFSRYTCPPLTTVAQDYDAISRHSVSTLIERMDDRSSGSKTTLFEGTLIMRESA
ncbi:MAG: LacI family DNA-binding transcriptional regulator, partial [Pseudomonadota bacterium]